MSDDTEREAYVHYETLAQRMIRDGYEQELFEQRKRISELEDENYEKSTVICLLRHSEDVKIEQIDNLESLVRDSLRLLGAWDRADFDSFKEEYELDVYVPEGNYAALVKRANDLGIEVGA